MDENELMHHGVLGMRWGHRKARVTSSGSGRKSRSAKISELRKREDAKVRIMNAGGSKKKAISRVSRASTAKNIAKKGSLAAAAVLNAGYSASAAMGAASVASGVVKAAYVSTVLGSVAATPVAALGFGAVGLAAAGAAGATKIHQQSKNDREKINYIRKSK